MNMTPMQELIEVMNMSESEQKAYFENMKPDKTSTLLVQDLEKKEQNAVRDNIMARAKAFGYDDFRFTMMYDDCVCPKVKLVEDLTKAGYEDLAYNTMQGKYD